MKRINKFLFLFVLVFLPAYYLLPANRCLYAQDKVVAVVNNEVITQKDLSDFLNFIRLQYSRQFEGKALEEKVAAAKTDMLQRLIEDRIILQQAKLEKVTADPSRVKSKVEDIKKHYKSEAEFEDDLARQGLVQADLENKISEQLLMYNFIERKVRNKIVIRPDEITSFYAENKSQMVKPEERMLTLITFQEEDAARAVASQLRSGAKLEDLSAKYAFTTDKFSALAGQELRKEIADTVSKLAVGEIASPVKVDEQYFIFRLDSVIPSQQLSLTQAQDKIKGFLFEKKMQEELAKWIDEIKKESYIKILEN